MNQLLNQQPIKDSVEKVNKTAQEFKTFITRGNVVDMAVGVIIGGAFGKIVTSLVNDMIMPPIGMILGRVNFTNLFVSLTGQHYESLAKAQAAGAPTLNYGIFLNTIINFLIVAFAVFMMIKQVNRFTVKPPAAPPAPTTKPCPFCCSTIALKAVRCPQCTSEIGAAV